MPSIQDLDPNFQVSSDTPEDVVFHEPLESPMELTGLCDPAPDRYCRLPASLLPECSEGVRSLAWHTSGAQIRFATDSPYVSVAVKLREPCSFPHMPRTGHSGIDLYVGRQGAPVGDQWFSKVFFSGSGTYPGILSCSGTYPFPEKGIHEVTMHLPLYNGIAHLLVGVARNASLFAPVPYAVKKPVVFYGSSITQGGCASRPGNHYIFHLSRWLSCNVTCMGFSGSAKGEPNLAEYFGTLSMSAFVLDYDHNAPDAEHLRKTHYPFYQIIRRAQPDLPIILISKPDPDMFPDSRERLAVIEDTYHKAKAAGDGRIYLVSGYTLFSRHDRDACTVDTIHPNDLGFYRMAENICPTLKQALTEAGAL